MTFAIALDLGATFIKGARLCMETGGLGESVRRPFPPFREGLRSGRREVDLNAILAATRDVLQELSSVGPPPTDLFVCGQMHGLVLVSARGEPASAFISWQDERALEPLPGGSATAFEAVCQRLGDHIIGELGNELRPSFPLAKLYALAAYDQLTPGVSPVSLPDYVALSLCERLDRPVTDATNASAHGALDSKTRVWHSEALQRAGLAQMRWPEIMQGGAPMGVFRHGAGAMTVHVPIGDQQAALLGAGLTEDELSINIATGSQVSKVTGSPTTGNWQVRPYCGDTWLRTATHLPAGRALNALLGLLEELPAAQGTPLRDPWQRIEELAVAAAPPRMHATIAFFASAVGEYGSLDRITEDELHVGPLFRAAYRAMAANYLDAARRIAPEGWSRIVFSGGLAMKSPVLRHEIMSQLGGTFRIAPHTEDTLAGLSQLAIAVHPR